MKRKRLLSALAIGALVGTMAIGTVNSARAESDIRINGSSSSGYWVSGSMGTGSTDLHAVKSGDSRDYEDWAGGPKNDTVYLSGSGSLTLNHDLGTNHGRLYADGGNFTLSGNNITLTGGDYIKAAVNLAVNSGATLRIGNNGSVVLNSGDSIEGTINATGGTFTVSGGDHTLNSSSVIGSGVNFEVTGGTLKFANASILQKDFTNAGTLWFYGGTQDDKITNTANTTIHFVGTSNSGQVTGGTENVVFTGTSSNTGTIAANNLYVGESSTDVGNFTNNGTISTAADLGVRSGSSFTNKSGKSLTIGGSLNTASGATTTIENADNVTFTGTGSYNNNGSLYFKGGAISKAVSGSGTTYISTGEVTNNSAISQAVNVTTGTFVNATGGSVTGLTTISTDGTLNNTAGTLASVTNNGTFSVSGGQTGAVTNNGSMTVSGTNSTGIGAITNNKTLSITNGKIASVNNADATNSSVTQSGGSVTNDVTNAGSYTISGGSIGGTVTNTGTLSISTIGTIGGVTNSASGTLGASQSNGTVTTLSNSGKYTQSGGTVTTANNTGTYNLSGTGSTIENYSQSAGSLTIDGGASLEITDSTNGITGLTNAITGGDVNLGSSATSLGNLTINNGTTNTAKVTTTGGSELNIQNGALTTSTGTNIGNGAVVKIGTASGTTGTLNVTDGTVALGTNDNWNAKGEVNVNGGTLNLNGVTQTGTLSQTTSGTTNIASAQTLGTGASITGGTLNVDNNLTLTGGTITAGDGYALVSIDSGKTLDIQGGTVTLDGGSGHDQVDWNGTVKLGDGGTLILSNIYDTSRVTTGANKTGILNAEGGNLTINSSTVLLGNNDIIAQAVNLKLQGDIVVDSGANAYIDSSDDWTVGNITQTGGTLSLDGVSTAAGKTLNSDGGTLNVINTVKLATGADTIATGTTVNIAAGNTLDIDNTSVAGVTLDSGDTWEGAITLDGGNLELNGRTDTTTATKTFNQSTGKLTIDNGGSLTLNTADSKITGTSEVVLGKAGATPADDTAGTLVLNNGSANQAKITTAGTNAGSALTVKGKVGDNATTLTLTDGSDIQLGTVTVGDADKNANILTMAGDINGSKIAKEVTMVINEGAKVDMTGSKSELTINSLDIWNGQINQTAGTLTVLNDDYTRTTGYLTSDGGNIIIGHIGDPTAPSDPDVAGTLILNNTLDSITAATAVTINTNGKLAQSAGNVVLDNTNDNWNGAIELSGTGNLTLSGRADSTDATQTYNQTGGNLIIDNGGSLTLNTDTTGATPVSSAITGGTVQLGEAGNTAGTLVVNNGLTTNQAKVVTAGTNASNAFSVKGANTAFTTLTDTNFATGSVTVGDGTTNASVLNLSNNAIIAKEVALTVAENSTMNVADTAQTTINELDTWNGTINQTAGTITVLDNVVKNATTAKLTSNGGNIIIGHIGDPTDPSDPDIAGTLNLNNTLDSIAAATAVTINTNGTLKQSAGTVALNASGTGADTWNGAIDLSGTGNLTVSGFNKTTDGTVTYNQTGGKAKFDGTTLVLDPDTTKKSVISDGSVELTNGSTLTINNGENNNNAAVTMAAGTETMNVTGNSTMTLDSYIYGPTSAAPQLIETAISAGTLNVGDSADNTDHSTLEVASGTIAQAANVAINEGSALNITGADAQDAGTAPAIVAAVTLDSTDTWNGDINMSNAGTADDENISLTLNDIAITVGADPTFDNTGSSPYYSQTGGALILNNTSLSMEDATLINAPSGSMTLDTDSHFESQSGRFIVGDLQNAGVIHSINTGYENHLFDNHIIGDGAGDEKAEYTIDLYARSNANKNYDQFGKDSTSISATDLSTKHGIIHVSDWTLNGDIYGYDAPIDRSIAIDKLFKGSVAANHTIDFTSTDKEVFTPIGWYGLHSKGGGNYSFDLNRYNPGVFRGQVSTLAQYQNQLAIDDMIFNHTMVDQGFKGNDYIASNPNRLASANDLYPPYEYSRKDGGLWVKMYGNFERLHAGGLDVGNNAYGTIIGADFGLKELKHGWQFMPTAYIGYNGAHQYWNGYGAYQNGGQLGVMGTWYKNDFMIGAMAYGGVYGNEMSTPRGDDNAFNYFAGSAVKGAYNWKFAKNWALQPNLFVSYNYFGQQNWHSDFGQMGMMSGALNGINIAPGLNLIYERETWSAYVTLQYMYNINQATGGRAGNVDLPRLSMDRGYIQYGIGLNKKFTDRFSAYIQTVIRNVGRNGIGLQAGFQWRFGKCGSNSGKGNITPELKKTNITLSGNKVQ